MRSLVIAPQPFFSPRGTPFSVYYRTLVLSEMGVEIDLLTYGQGRDVEIPRTRILRIPRFARLGNVRVGPSLLKLFLDVVLIFRTLSLLLRNRYDYVHAHEEAIFFCRFLKPIFGFKLVYDMHSSLPQQLTNFQFTHSRFLIGAFEKLELTCLAHSDAVITICPELARYALAHVPDPERHLLIENSIFDPVRFKDETVASHDTSDWEPRIPEGRPIVSYGGTLEPYQGIDMLIPAFAAVRREIPDAFLLMIGGSEEQVRRYREMAHDEGLEGHCLFTGAVEPTVARKLLARADVLTSPRAEGTNTPLKIYEQLASGKPLVATRILSHTQVLTDDVCFLADPDSASLARAMIAALSDRERCQRTVTAAQDLYDRQYSRPAYEGKIRRLLDLVS